MSESVRTSCRPHVSLPRAISGLVVMSLLMSASTVQADEASQLFESLYGGRIKQVKATVDRSDDLTLAKEMLSAARTVERADMLSVMCDHIIELSQRHADGLTIAVDAARLIAEKVESRRADSRNKMVELLSRQIADRDAKVRENAADELVTLLVEQGDEAAGAGRFDESMSRYRQALPVAQRLKQQSAESVKERLALAGHRSRTAAQIARLREKLLANANDVAAVHEMIRLYVVDLDDPAGAAALVVRAQDDKLKMLVPLASKPAASVDASSALALGEWYAELSREAAAPSNEAMMRRASVYLKLFLASKPDDELTRLRAELALKPITASLATMEAERLRIGLKRTGPESWISSEAKYRLSSEDGVHRPLPGLLNGGKDLHSNSFAFHTNANAAPQYVVIDLGSPKVVSRIWIENRRGGFAERAKGMSVFLKMESKEKVAAVWTADKVANEWTIQLPQNVKAQYLIIRQADGNGAPLHLAQVKVFGWEK